MRLVHSDLGLVIDILEGKHTILVIENPNTMNMLITELKYQIEGDDGGFVLSDKKELPIDKSVDFLINLWNLDMNTKRIKTKLLQLAVESANDYLTEAFITLRTEIFSFMEKIKEKIPYQVDYNIGIDTSDLMKMLDIHISIAEGSFLEQLVEYLKLNSELCGVKLFVVLNLQMFLNEEDLSMLYKELEVHKICLLDIEGYFNRPTINSENLIVIDRDNCIISI